MKESIQQLKEEIDELLIRIDELRKQGKYDEVYVLGKRLGNRCNNIITKQATHNIAGQIADILNLSEQEKTTIIESADEQHANSRGFDIRVEQPQITKNVIAEIKCFEPKSNKLNGGSHDLIKHDLDNLIKGKGNDKNKLTDTTNYYKFFGIKYTGDVEIVMQRIIKQYSPKVVLYTPDTKVSKDYIYVIYIR